MAVILKSADERGVCKGKHQVYCHLMLAQMLLSRQHFYVKAKLIALEMFETEYHHQHVHELMTKQNGLQYDKPVSEKQTAITLCLEFMCQKVMSCCMLSSGAKSAASNSGIIISKQTLSMCKGDNTRVVCVQQIKCDAAVHLAMSSRQSTQTTTTEICQNQQNQMSTP